MNRRMKQARKFKMPRYYYHYVAKNIWKIPNGARNSYQLTIEGSSSKQVYFGEKIWRVSFSSLNRNLKSIVTIRRYGQQHPLSRSKPYLSECRSNCKCTSSGHRFIVLNKTPKIPSFCFTFQLFKKHNPKDPYSGAFVNARRGRRRKFKMKRNPKYA